MARIGELLGPNQEVIHPQTSASVVYLEDGRSVEQVLSDDIDYGNVVFQESSYKFSSDVEDDFAKTVVIKGQTYQNILPEPSTHVLSSNKEIFKVNEGLDPNVEIVDGISKSAILSGQTKYRDEDGDIHDSFVQIPNEGNLYKGTRDFNTTYWEFGLGASPLEPFELNPNFKQATLTSNYQHLTTPTSKQGFMFDNPNKTWTISAMFKGSQEGQMIGITLDATRLEYDKKPVVNGQWTRLTWTFQGSTTLQKFRFENKSLQGTIKVAQVMVTETDHAVDWKPALQDGEHKSLELVSCRMPVLTTTGKNLSPINSFTGIVTTVNDSLVGIDKLIKKNIVLNPNKTYICSTKCSNNAIVNNMKVLLTNIELPDNNIEGSSSHNSIYTWTVNNGGKQGSINTPLTGYKYAHITTGGSFSNQHATRGDLIEYYDIQLEENSVATTYEPHKTNILHTPEEVVLKGIGDVRDTLNCNTGEYVRRFGEIVLDGTQGFKQDVTSGDFKRFTLQGSFVSNMKIRGAIMCDKFVQIPDANATQEGITTGGSENYRLMLWVESSRLSTPDVAGLQAWLQANPVTVQYELTTPIVKTIDLSTSGNWEKTVLNGSEKWSKRGDGDGSTTIGFHTPIDGVSYTLLFAEGVERSQSSTDGIEGYGFDGNQKNFFIEIKRSKLSTVDVNGFKQWLQQNPVTVWHQTQTHQDSTKVKQPIFFKDGHIIQSSWADHSLIPTLDYQAKTSNSYVMDLMKANTRYTMKAKSASGNFTLGGSSYSLGTNRVFSTTGAEFNANNMMVITGSYEDLMILEGELTSKTIPYFKGIKSAFEDESKIEVLSTSQNILDTSKIVQGDLLNSGVTAATGGSADLYCYTEEFIPCPNIKHPLYVHRTVDGVYSSSTCYIFFFDEDKRLLQPRTVSNTFTIPDGAKYLRIMVHKGNIDVSRVGIMVTNSGTDRFNQSVGGLQNNTKIPLLSPLRSLPNGVCDELIIDRMKKKATLINRLDHITFDGSSDENWHSWGINNGVTHLNSYHYVDGTNNTKNLKVKANPSWFTSRLGYGGGYTSNKTGASLNNSYFAFSIPKNLIGAGGGDTTTMCEKNARKWLSQNPVTVYYELATPIVTEIDLEGFPYIYKEGHIFLNSEIAPTVGIEYSLNQGHRISSQVETLQRHEQQFTKLERYFADLVHSDYNFALLRFSEKLHQQEGDV